MQAHKEMLTFVPGFSLGTGADMTQGEKSPVHSFQAVNPCDGLAHLAELSLTAHCSGVLRIYCLYQCESAAQSAGGICFIYSPQPPPGK